MCIQEVLIEWWEGGFRLCVNGCGASGNLFCCWVGVPFLERACGLIKLVPRLGGEGVQGFPLGVVSIQGIGVRHLSFVRAGCWLVWLILFLQRFDMWEGVIQPARHRACALVSFVPSLRGGGSGVPLDSVLYSMIWFAAP